MLPDDIFCRAALHPSAFKKGIFNAEHFFNFHEEEAEGYLKFSQSFASKWLCRDEDGVHSYGVEVARQGNASKRARKGRDLERLEQTVYLGFYQIFCRAIEGVTRTHLLHSFYWKPEGGLDSHFQLELTGRLQVGKGVLRNEMRDVRAALALQAWGPWTYVIDAAWVAELEGYTGLPRKEKGVAFNT